MHCDPSHSVPPGDATPRSQRILLGAVVLGFVSLNLAYVLMLPPYEGFDDKSSHYSYISLLADRGVIADFRFSPLDATMEGERSGLPRPYATTPPFDKNGG